LMSTSNSLLSWSLIPSENLRFNMASNTGDARVRNWEETWIRSFYWPTTRIMSPFGMTTSSGTLFSAKCQNRPGIADDTITYPVLTTWLRSSFYSRLRYLARMLLQAVESCCIVAVYRWTDYWVKRRSIGRLEEAKRRRRWYRTEKVTKPIICGLGCSGGLMNNH
jgi:hypothetical protein